MTSAAHWRTRRGARFKTSHIPWPPVAARYANELVVMRPKPLDGLLRLLIGLLEPDLSDAARDALLDAGRREWRTTIQALPRATSRLWAFSERRADVDGNDGSSRSGATDALDPDPRTAAQLATCIAACVPRRMPGLEPLREIDFYGQPDGRVPPPDVVADVAAVFGDTRLDPDETWSPVTPPLVASSTTSTPATEE
jgi:hypothetical protein